MRSRAKIGSNHKQRLEKLAKELGYQLVYKGEIPYFVKGDERIPYAILDVNGEIINKYVVVSKTMFEKLKRFYELTKQGDPFKFAKPVVYYNIVKGIRFKGENSRY
ncbi:MAG: hypothetical protein RXO36_05140 [Candidatus Nanopusillus acidilobi]|jgi:hypothetical protein